MIRDFILNIKISVSVGVFMSLYYRFSGTVGTVSGCFFQAPFTGVVTYLTLMLHSKCCRKSEVRTVMVTVADKIVPLLCSAYTE